MDTPELSPEHREMLEKIEASRHSDPQAARDLCEQIFAASRKKWQPLAHVKAAEYYAIILDHQGRSRESIDMLFEALQAAQSAHLFAGEAHLLEGIARGYYTAGEYRLAIYYWARCIEIANLAGNEARTWMLAKVGLGAVYYALEDYAAALEMHEAAASRIPEVDDPYLEAKIIINLGVDRIPLGQQDEAAPLFQQALVLCLQHGYADYAAECFFHLGELETLAGKLDLAADHLDQALLSARSVSYRWCESKALAAYADVYALRGDAEAALEHIFIAQAIARQYGLLHMLVHQHFAAANYAEAAGNLSLSLAEFRAGHDRELELHAASSATRQEDLENKAGLRPSASRMLVELANNRLIDDGVLDEVFELLTAQACQIMGIQRASVWLLTPAEQETVELKCACLYIASEQAYGTEPALLRDKYPAFFGWLDAPDALLAHDAIHHPYTWELAPDYFTPHGIKSLLAFAIRSAGHIAGLMCFEHIGLQRNWTPDDALHGSQLADIATRALGNHERKKFQRLIKTLNFRLTQANEALEAKVKTRTAALESANAELHQAMDKLVQSEKLASLGSLVAGIAHELNTPLGCAMTVATTLNDETRVFTQLLQDGQLRKSDLETYMQKCGDGAVLLERNIHRANDLISNFKEVAIDTTSMRRRVFDLRVTVNEVLATLTPLFKHTPYAIKTDIPEQIMLDSYPGPLEQVITNLVTNSLLHGFDGRKHGHVHIWATAPGSASVVLHYEDDGRGIPAELLKRVFDPFFTTRLGEGGSGLGLYLVYNLVTNVMGGAVKLTSEHNRFTRFELTLPLNPAVPDGEQGLSPFGSGVR